MLSAFWVVLTLLQRVTQPMSVTSGIGVCVPAYCLTPHFSLEMNALRVGNDIDTEREWVLTGDHACITLDYRHAQGTTAQWYSGTTGT